MRVAGCPVGLLPVAAALIATGPLPPAWATLVVLGTVILLGVPHGALDGEFARPLLRPRFGRWWFGVFALPYLGLAAAVLLAWRLAPLPTLGAFLAASAWHFGTEDAGPRPLEAVVRGGLVMAVPVLAHPTATASLFGTIAMMRLPAMPEWLAGAAWAWCALALIWGATCLLQRQAGRLAEPALLAVCFILLPPLTAFALYFVCIHAPRHMAGVIADPAAPRTRTIWQAVRQAAPISALTVLIGAALWPWFPGTAPDRLLALTIEGLAALTLPHMLLDLAIHASWAPRPATPALVNLA